HLQNLGDGDLENDLIYFGVALVLKELAPELLLGVELGEPLLIGLPVEVSAGAPFGEMMFVESLAVGPELFEDGAGIETVVHHAVYGIAGIFGKAGYMASAGARFWFAGL